MSQRWFVLVAWTPITHRCIITFTLFLTSGVVNACLTLVTPRAIVVTGLQFETVGGTWHTFCEGGVDNANLIVPGNAFTLAVDCTGA